MSTCDDDRKRAALQKRRETGRIFKVKISQEVEANLGEIGDGRGFFDRARDAFGRLFGDNRAYASRLLLHNSKRSLKRSRSNLTAHWRSVPAHSLSKRRDVGDVMSSVPGVDA